MNTWPSPSRIAEPLASFTSTVVPDSGVPSGTRQSNLKPMERKSWEEERTAEATFS